MLRLTLEILERNRISPVPSRFILQSIYSTSAAAAITPAATPPIRPSFCPTALFDFPDEVGALLAVAVADTAEEEVELVAAGTSLALSVPHLTHWLLDSGFALTQLAKI